MEIISLLLETIRICGDSDVKLGSTFSTVT